MTGFGRAQRAFSKHSITIEIKSVNNRYFDCFIRLGRAYIFLEDAIKSQIQSVISRGKLDVFVTVEKTEAAESHVSCNKSLVANYVEIMKGISEEFEIPNIFSTSDLLRIPEVITAERGDEDEEELKSQVIQTLDAAAEELLSMSKREGERIEADITGRIQAVLALVHKIKERAPKIIREYKGKFTKRLEDALKNVTIEPERILTEVAIFADRSNIDEEIVRLLSHIEEFRKILKKGGAVGKKLDFLIQELNRETNTIGSKANDVAVTRMVVDLKAEIEKIREQIQNIE